MVLLRYEEADSLALLFIVIGYSNVRASWVNSRVGCLGSFVWSSPAVAIEQDPELVGQRQQMAHSLAACNSHLPPFHVANLNPISLIAMIF
jgi:hypothetical protein